MLRVGQFYLIYWQGEGSVSVVAEGSVTADGPRDVGKVCSIRIGRKTFPGKIAAIGKQ